MSWVSTFIVARLLGPADIGLMGMAAVYLGLATLFTQFGLATVIITLRDLDDDQLAQINTVAILLGLAGFVASCALAMPIAHFFGAPELIWVIVALSAGFIVGAFRTVPAALLQKEMRFKLLALIEGCQTLGQSLTTLVLALLGFRYWALVVGSLIGTLILAAAPLAWRAHRFARPRMQTILEPIRFGWHVLVNGLAWYGYSNSDFLVAGRVLGQAPLGAYTVAWNLASAPLEKITNLVTGVTPAVFSAVQTEHSMLRRYLFSLTEALALVTFPATVGLALVADELVHAVLGDKWGETVLPLEILAIYAALRSIVTLLPQVLTAVGDARFVMRTTLAALMVLPVAFYQGSRWGAVGIACGWVFVYPFVPLLLYRRLLPKIGMSANQYLAALKPALNASLAMAASVGLIKWALPSEWAPAWRLLIEVLAGATVYTLTLFGFHRDRIRTLVQRAGGRS